MKFRITKGQNSCDGNDIFYVYEFRDNRWAYATGFAHEADARTYVARRVAAPPEVIISEIEV